MLLEIGVVLLAVVIVGFIYMKLYYRRFNRVIGSNETKLYKVSPTTLNIGLVLLGLMSLTSLSIMRVEVLGQEIERYEEILLNDPYKDFEDQTGVIAKVYNEYNNYFAGFILEEGRHVIFITEDSPDSLIELFENTNYSYRFVEYNYAILHQVMETILNQVKDDKRFVSITVDIEDNIVKLGLTDINIDQSTFESYLADNLLVIVEKEPMDLHSK